MLAFVKLKLKGEKRTIFGLIFAALAAKPSQLNPSENQFEKQSLRLFIQKSSELCWKSILSTSNSDVQFEGAKHRRSSSTSGCRHTQTFTVTLAL